MIQEIANFVEILKQENFSDDLNLRDEGLYIIIRMDKNNIPLRNNHESILYRKKGSEKYHEFINSNNLKMMEYYSECIDANKYLDTGGNGSKKIHSSVPYSIWFRKENINNIEERLKNYFDATIALAKGDDEEIRRINNIRIFCEEYLLTLLKGENHLNELKDNDYIKIFFDVGISEYRKSYDRYLSVKVFNKEDQGKEFGQAIFLNGAPDKKLLVVPKTAIYKTNLKISKTMALRLEKFKRLLTSKPNKKLPNPLPIFIDKDELNNQVISLYSKENKLNFHEIIKSIFEDYTNDVSDYYLINWSNTKDGLVINDVDYVSLFIYKLENFKISNVIGTKKNKEELERDIDIKNVFQLEQIFDKNFFYRIQKNTGYRYGSVMNNYFSSDPTPPKGYELRAITKINLLRYRKVIYDYIYKSKTNTITAQIFYEMIISSIIDDIKIDDNFFNTKYIQEKLNILFSLNKNFGGKNMASKIPELQEKLKKLLDDENYHIQDDDEFAFDAGQLIYYIIYQSESSNKSHALLEPYISKNDPKLFKLTITRGIEQYKHNFPFGTKRFPKLASEVLGYDCKTKIKEMLPLLLGGYFSNSLLFDLSNKTKN